MPYHRVTLSFLPGRKAGEPGSEPHGEQPPRATFFFGSSVYPLLIPSNISLTFGGLAGENKKAAENIRFQTARLANRLRSSTNWFENCPARATIFKTRSDNGFHFFLIGQSFCDILTLSNLSGSNTATSLWIKN